MFVVIIGWLTVILLSGPAPALFLGLSPGLPPVGQGQPDNFERLSTQESVPCKARQKSAALADWAVCWPEALAQLYGCMTMLRLHSREGHW